MRRAPYAGVIRIRFQGTVSIPSFDEIPLAAVDEHRSAEHNRPVFAPDSDEIAAKCARSASECPCGVQESIRLATHTDFESRKRAEPADRRGSDA